MKRNSNNWNVKMVNSMIKKGTITFDNPVQRPSGQWNYRKKSLLINSMLSMFIPEVYAIQYNKNINGKSVNAYDIIDGKQRLTTIMDFIDDAFLLEGFDKITLETTGEEFDVNGLRFSELPEDVQDDILGFNLTFKNIVLDEEDEEEIVDEIFYRLNNGTPVSRQHLALTSSPKHIQNFVRDIMNHDLFTKISHFTKTSIKKSNKEMTVLQTIILLSEIDFKSFTARHVEDFFQNNTITEEVLQKTVTAFDNIVRAFQKHHKFVQKTHIPIMSMISNYKEFDGFINHYAEITHKDDEYKQYCGAGCTKKEMVFGRVKSLDKLYIDYTKSITQKNA